MSDDEMKQSNYEPIPCDLYSEYEVAILHRTPLRLHWRDEAGMEHIDRLTPRDLQTRDHCEYLIGDNGEGEELQIRLDHIIKPQTEME